MWSRAKTAILKNEKNIIITNDLFVKFCIF